MDRWLTVASTPTASPPAEFGDDDVRFSDDLARAFIEEYTRPRDLVVDPFAGFGTTLLVGARAGRRAVGVELLTGRTSFIQAHAADDVIVHCADSRAIGELGLADVQLVMTSPPYMTATDHPQNPLTGYQTTDGDYSRYLEELTDVFAQLRPALNEESRVVVNAANIRHGHVATPLAWDIQRALSRVLHFDHEVVIVNDQLPEWITQEYCLVFRR